VRPHRNVNELLAQLEMLSEASGTAADQTKQRPTFESKPPRGEESDHDYHRRQILGASTQAQHALAVQRAEIALERNKWRAIPTKDGDEWERLVVIRHVGRRPEYVADAENCSVSLVKKIRAKSGKDRITGV